jgi:hypothetical protein
MTQQTGEITKKSDMQKCSITPTHFHNLNCLRKAHINLVVPNPLLCIKLSLAPMEFRLQMNLTSSIMKKEFSNVATPNHANLLKRVGGGRK